MSTTTSNKVIVIKGDTNPVSKNFIAAEFFTRDYFYKKNDHDFDSRLFRASQYVREWCNCPVKVSSTLRTYWGNILASGSSSKSKHLEGIAVDLNPDIWTTAMIDSFRQSVHDRNGIFSELYNMGIRGFGVYSWGLHLDTRTEGGKNTHGSGSFAYWQGSDLPSFNSITKTDDINNLTIDGNNEEFSNPIFTYSIITIVFVFFYRLLNK